MLHRARAQSIPRRRSASATSWPSRRPASPVADHPRLSLSLAPVHEALELAAFVIGQPADLHGICHDRIIAASLLPRTTQVVDRPGVPDRSGH